MMDTNLESAKTVTRKWGKSLQKSCPGSYETLVILVQSDLIAMDFQMILKLVIAANISVQASNLD